MSNYSKEHAQRNSKLSESFTATDEKVFSILNQIGVGGKRVLDFGCGDGRNAFHIAELGAREVVGIDVSSEMIEVASRELKNKKIGKVKFIEGDGSKLQFGDNSFDVVFSNFVLHHFEDTLKPLSEISRVLDKNGFLLGTFITGELSDKKLFNKKFPLRLGREPYIEVHKMFKSDKEMQLNFQKAGLKVLQYSEEKNLLLSMLTYANEDKVSRMKTMICLAQKAGISLEFE